MNIAERHHRELPAKAKEMFESCIATSESLIHLRPYFWDHYPEDDDGNTMCGRKRTRDFGDFWEASAPCGDCLEAVHDMHRSDPELFE